MRNRFLAILFMLFIVLILAACGDSGKNDSETGDTGSNDSDNGSSETSEKGDERSYSLAEKITSEDGFLHNLQIDEAGDVILFRKGEQGDEHPMVYVNGDTTELNTDYFGMHSYMTRDGVVLGDSTEDHETYTYHFHDARSGEETEHTVDQGPVSITYQTDYIEDDDDMFDVVLRSNVPKNQFQLDFFNLAEDTYDRVDFDEYLKDFSDTGKFDRPHAFYSPDGDTVYLLVRIEDDNGDYISSFHSYDIDSGDKELIAEIDGFFSLADINAPFTAKGESMLLLSNDDTLHELTIESGEVEPLDLNNGSYFHMMQDNGYAWMDRDTGEVTVGNLDDDTSEVVHTLDDMDDIRIGNFAISKNGNTIAYIYKDTSEDETTHHLEILHAD